MAARRNKKNSYALGHDRPTQAALHLMMLPGTISIIIFHIIPIFGLIIAFTDFKPAMGWSGIFTSNWNNFTNFRRVFSAREFWPMIRNTVGINLWGQLVSFPTAIVFALLLNEIRSPKRKSLVQTVSYLPHFLSWAIYGGLLKTIISADNGAFNRLLVAIGAIAASKEWIADPNYFWAISIISGLLKDLGWSAIIYLAAIAGVDPTLYEVVEIDGGNRFHKMVHVTLPAILPTVMVMLIFAISGMLNNNFTQVYILQNSLNMKASNVIDTYIYQIGMQKFQFNIATAAGLAKSFFALILLFGANFASRKLTDHSLF